jgi:pimeloyl-ACP methyl ester carboxylesterase
LRRLIAWTLATPLSIANSARTLAMLFGPQRVPGDFGVRGGGLLSLRPVSFIGASTDLVATHGDPVGMPARFENLTVPVGILFGADDRILDPVVHGKGLAAKVAGADFELIEGGGHMIPVTSADRTAAFIARMAQRAGLSAVSSPAKAGDPVVRSA